MSSLAKKIDTKTWVIIGLGGVTVVAGFALFSQWKHATLGRKVRRSVVRFLKDHGSVVQSGIVTGGVVQQPLKIDTAVNATVVQMLNGVADLFVVQWPEQLDVYKSAVDLGSIF